MSIAVKPYNDDQYAGSRGDIWKHFSLLRCAEALSKQIPANLPFHYFETHAGPGCNTLDGSGGWLQGAGLVLDRELGFPDLYFALMRFTYANNREYLGSWRLMQAYLAQLRSSGSWTLTLCETDEAAIDRINSYLQRSFSIDSFNLLSEPGFKALQRHSDADLILIDPPYTSDMNKADDWIEAASAAVFCARTHANFILCYPVDGTKKPQQLVNALGLSGLELLWDEPDPNGLQGCGLIAGGECAPILRSHKKDLMQLATNLGGDMRTREPANMFTERPSHTN